MGIGLMLLVRPEPSSNSSSASLACCLQDSMCVSASPTPAKDSSFLWDSDRAMSHCLTFLDFAAKTSDQSDQADEFNCCDNDE